MSWKHFCYFCNKAIGTGEDNAICQFRFPDTMRLVETCREHSSIQDTPTPGMTKLEDIVKIMENIKNDC